MNDELKSLRAQLDSLKLEFTSKVSSIENQIIAIQQQRNDQESTTKPIIQASQPQIHQEKSQAVGQATSEVQFVDIKSPNASKRQQNPIPIPQPYPSSSQSQQRARTKRKTSALEAGVYELLAALFGPLVGIVGKLSSVYRHYQAQGKAPVFFMTAAGISAMILGFGYLLQYSFTQYLSEMGKVLVGYVIAIGITAGGIRFTRKHPNMTEYGSGIIGLGIILNYLCTYFIGSYYSIVPTIVSFILLAIITACAYVIALLFETRIVAIVTLVGGAFAPVLLGQVTQPPYLYFSYLLILVMAMLHLSQRIRWQTLAHTSMVISVALIQYCLIDLPFMQHASIWLVALLHGFFYGFAYFAINDISRSNAVTRTTVLIVSANLIFLLVVLEQVVSNTQVYGVLLILNTVVWLACTVAPGKIFVVGKAGKVATNDPENITRIPELGAEDRQSIQVMTLLSAGVLAGVGILVLTDPQLLGLIWGIEGLMLLYLGARFSFYSVRIESYIIIAIALIKSSFDVVIWIFESLQPAPMLLHLEFGLGWLNLMVATSLIWGTVFILNKVAHQQNTSDKKLKSIGNESLSVYVSAAFLLSVGMISSQWMWALAIVPLFFHIYRSKRHSLKFTEYFGFAHYLLLLVPMVVSADQADSFRFMEQSIMGKFARIEAFLCLWGLAEFYHRVYPAGLLVQFANILRIVFYCLIPVFFLPSVLRRHAEYFPLVIWGSSAISLLMFARLKYKALQIETLVLVILSSISAAVACGLMEFNGWNGYGTSGLMLGLAFYGFLLWKWKGFARAPHGNEQFIFVRKGIQLLLTLSLYYTGLVIFILGYGYSHFAGIAAAITGLFFTVILIKQPAMNPLRRGFSYMYVVTWTIIILVNMTYFILTMLNERNIAMQSVAVIMALGCGAALVYLNRTQLTLVWRKLGGQLLHLWIFHASLIICYISLIEYWFDHNAGPALSVALVVHATIVLFQTLKVRFQRLIWIAISLFVIAAIKVLFFDMSDFSLVEKIIAFMLIGALLLGAAYQYQKMRRVA